MNVLFVCLGNIGRSQMAESMFNELARGRHISKSAGLDVGAGEGQLLKDSPYANAVLAVMGETGIDMSNKVRRQIDSDMVTDADKVIVMTAQTNAPNYVEAHPDVSFWDVEDPYQKSMEDTRELRDKIKGLVEDLIASLV